MSFFLSAILLGLALCALGFGIYISLKIFHLPDITTDGSYTLGAAICAVGITSHWPLLFTFALVVIGGFVAGLCTGFIHTKLKVNALLAGILVMTGLYSVNLQIMARPNIPLIDVNSIFSYSITNNTLLNHALVLVVLVLALLLLLTYLLKTDYGLVMRATGTSETMVRAAGVNTNKVKMLGLGIANALSAFSGFVIAQYQAFADINMGIGIVISALGAVIIGEALMAGFRLSGFFGKLLSVVVGSVVFRLLLAAALYSGLDPNWLKLATAILVLFVISLGPLKRQFSL